MVCGVPFHCIISNKSIICVSLSFVIGISGMRYFIVENTVKTRVDRELNITYLLVIY